MKETILKTAPGSTQEASGVQAQPFNRIEPIIDNFGDRTIATVINALNEKDLIIRELQQKIKALENQNNDLDYLLNSGRNKYEQERNKKIKELEAKIAKLETKESKPEIKWTRVTARIPSEDKNLTKIQGILTSNLRSRPSSDVPAMAFLRKTRECQQHTIAECQGTKCKDCEIPVIFRVKGEEVRHRTCWTDGNCSNCKRELVKPNLNKGDKVVLEGEFSPSEKSNRPSFTCYSYKLISHE